MSELVNTGGMGGQQSVGREFMGEQ